MSRPKRDRTSLELLPPSVVTQSGCVVVVIDVQNDFCSSRGAFANQGRDLTRIKLMIPRLRRFLDASRRRGLRIAFIRYEYDPSAVPKAVAARFKPTPGDGGVCAQAQTWGSQFYGAIRPEQGEPVFTKHLYSAFSSREFIRFLREMRVETLVLTGVLSNVCVETTARDAELFDLNCIVVRDCVASDSLTLHNAALANLQTYFGWVCGKEDLLRFWSSRRQDPRVPTGCDPGARGTETVREARARRASRGRTKSKNREASR